MQHNKIIFITSNANKMKNFKNQRGYRYRVNLYQTLIYNKRNYYNSYIYISTKKKQTKNKYLFRV